MIMQTQLPTFNVQPLPKKYLMFNKLCTTYLHLMSPYWYSTSYARPIKKKKKKLTMHANNSWQYIYHIPLRSTIHDSNTAANQI